MNCQFSFGVGVNAIKALRSDEDEMIGALPVAGSDAVADAVLWFSYVSC